MTQVQDPPAEEQRQEDGPRRRPSTLGGLVYLVVGATQLFGLVVVAFGDWRRGVTVMGTGLALAALGRGVLRDADAGMLAVRSRWFDAAVLALGAVGLILLAAVIPSQVA